MHPKRFEQGGAGLGVGRRQVVGAHRDDGDRPLGCARRHEVAGDRLGGHHEMRRPTQGPPQRRLVPSPAPAPDRPRAGAATRRSWMADHQQAPSGRRPPQRAGRGPRRMPGRNPPACTSPRSHARVSNGPGSARAVERVGRARRAGRHRPAGRVQRDRQRRRRHLPDVVRPTRAGPRTYVPMPPGAGRRNCSATRSTPRSPSPPAHGRSLAGRRRRRRRPRRRRGRPGPQRTPPS